MLDSGKVEMAGRTQESEGWGKRAISENGGGTKPHARFSRSVPMGLYLFPEFAPAKLRNKVGVPRDRTFWTSPRLPKKTSCGFRDMVWWTGQSWRNGDEKG